MKILLTGGGTGGHITPLLAVADKLKQAQPNATIMYVGERGSRFADMTKGKTVFDKQHRIFAGKLRRYHGESWLKRVSDVRTNLFNLRDACFLLLGIIESLVLLRRLRPDVILLKGGFVGVPIGLAAAFWKIPFVTHDSDAVPGLANRIVSRWARYHATAMPAEHYSYPPDSVRPVGVLVGDAYRSVTPELQREYRRAIGVPEDAQLLMITGGSNGAQAINRALVGCAERLLQEHPHLYIVHQVGRNNESLYGQFRHHRLAVQGLLQDMYAYSGAADVVITRAGANTLAELGVQGKACVVVPNPLLTGGHQLKNAQHLAMQQAVVVVEETALLAEQGGALYDAVTDLLHNPDKRSQLGQALQSITISDAASKLAQLLVQVAEQESHA